MRLVRRVALAALVPLLALAPRPAAAQGGVVQGVVDLEGWRTDPRSFLLARDAGHAAVLGRLDLWGAYELRRGLTVYALGEAVGGRAAGEHEAELEQGGIRWAPRDGLVIDAGKITSPVGTFAGRRLSTRNPLVGAPDGYPVTYPWGVQLAGEAGMLDWRAAVMSLPVVHEGYAPDPSARARPAFAVGLTPAIGVHVGASYTAGSYLDCDLPTALYAGRSWMQYHERVAAADVEVSRGYLELWAEAARSGYDVPGRGAMRGTTGYLEGRYTFMPRLYLAARVEENDYPYIQPLDPTRWLAVSSDVRNAEAGLGVRLTASRLLKATVRRSWMRHPGTGFAPDGRAVAVQLSQGLDIF